jgi:putative FmdB family regulatory protein
MPIYEYQCKTCNEVSEFLVLGSDDQLTCKRCKGKDLVKLMSAHSPPAASHGHEATIAGGCCGAPNSCGRPGSCCS